MIEAKTQAEKFAGYHRAFTKAKDDFSATWHDAWREYHRFYSRRVDGNPLRPGGGISTHDPAVNSANRLQDDEILAVNHVQAIIRTELTATLNRQPEFHLEPEFFGYDAPQRARLGAQALNWEWRKRKMNKDILDATLDSFIYGRGWVQVGWQSTYTDVIEQEGRTPSDIVSDSLKAMNLLSRKGARLGHKPFTPEQIQQHLSSFGGRLLVEDRPTLTRVSPFNMFYDPLATDPSEARWIAKRWLCPAAYAANNKDWSAKARKALGAKSVETTLDPQSMLPGAGQEYDGSDTVWIVDFFDLGSGEWCQFSPSGEGFLMPPKPIPFTFGHPFVWRDNITDPSSSVPISEVEIMWMHQRDLSAIASELGRDRVNSRQKILVPDQYLEMLKPILEASDQGIVAGIPADSGAKISEMFADFQGQSQAQMLSGELSMVANWMTEATGVSDFLRGQAVAGQTATQTNALASAANNYMGEKGTSIRNFIEECGQRILMLMTTHSKLSHHISTKVPNPDRPGEMIDATIAFDRQHYQGQYRVIVLGDSTEEKTPQAKQARAQAIAATAVPFIQAGVVDPAKLFNMVMKEGFGMADPTTLLTQQAYIAGRQPLQASEQQGFSGVSMTPGSGAGQLGASAAQERTEAGESVPPNETE